jgi:uncharacterized lipoprotein YehR (DUF1307 family)
MKDRYIKDILEELVDALEEKYGNIEGFECRLEHKPNAEGNIEIGYIKEFSISYLHKTVIDIKDLK